MSFTLSSPAFAVGAAIPLRYTCDGDNVSPPLAWSDPPAGTGSFALLMDDPDAPSGTFTHWLLCDLPATQRTLDEALPAGRVGTSGTNGFLQLGYGGPCPPKGHGRHRYHIHLFALAHALDLQTGYTRADFEEAISSGVMGVARLVGTFSRRR